MIEVATFLAWYGSDGTAIGNIFTMWQQIGFFSYLLPFLIIFALVFGILTKVNLFRDNKVVNAIIALAVGLIAIQFPGVSEFFSVIFPHLGIALAVILVILIVAGLFVKNIEKKWINYVLAGIAGIIVIVVLVQTAGVLGWPAAQWWIDNWAMIIAVVVIVGLVIAVVATASKSPPPGG